MFAGTTKIKIFPNGNFAQKIKLPRKKNIIRLIHILNGKEKIISRNVIVKYIKNVIPNLIGNPEPTILDSHFRRNDISIVIDPGHGGKEHGTHSPKGIPEKVFNLQIAKLLVETLHETSLQVKIHLTRNKDIFVSLKDRVHFAKKIKCNLFISIHHNALPDNEDPLKHKGVGIYYTHDFAKPFAKTLLNSISNVAELKQYGIFKRNFAVTRPSFYCGVLIECGFLIHPLEANIITRKITQEKIVNGIVKGLSLLLK